MSNKVTRINYYFSHEHKTGNWEIFDPSDHININGDSYKMISQKKADEIDGLNYATRSFTGRLIDVEGNIFYLRQGVLHRNTGAAVLLMDGTEEYWKNGALHRDDGAAIVYAQPKTSYRVSRTPNEYYLNGEAFSYEDWLRYQKDTKFWPLIMANHLGSRDGD